MACASSAAIIPVAGAGAARVAGPTAIVITKTVDTDETKDWSDWLALGSQVVALFALPIIALQLFFDRRSQRMQQTTELLRRWEARELVDVHSRVAAFLQPRNPANCVDKTIAWERVTYRESSELPRPALGAPKPSKTDIDYMHNFFEDVGVRYNQKTILHDPVVASIGYLATYVFQQSLWLIHFEREKQRKPQGPDVPLYREWETMCADLRGGASLDRRLPFERRAPSLKEAQRYICSSRLELPQSPAVICLPPRHATASRGDVDVARRLSVLLKDRALASGLERAAGSAGSTSPANGWLVLITPTKIGACASDVSRDRERARRIARRLDQLGSAGIAALLAGHEAPVPRAGASGRPVSSC